MASSEAPDFVLRLVEGRGMLGLRSATRLPLGKLERLELEVPNLRFPFDGSGDATRFRNRRCTVRDALLRIDDEQLGLWLASRPLARYGVADLRGRVTGDRIQLTGAITIGDRTSPFTCTARFATGATDGSHVTIELDHLVTYSLLPAPAPLVGLALLYALGARPVEERGKDTPPGFVLRGIDAMETDALRLVLWRSLLPWGWRLPRTGVGEHPRVSADGRSLLIAFSPKDDGVATPLADPGSATLRDGDRRLADGDLAGALASYEQTREPRARERRLATLAVMPDRRSDAIALGEALLVEAPDRNVARTLLANLLAPTDPGRASDLFSEAASIAERAGEPAAAIEAALRAAELILPVRPMAATPLLERVMAGRPTHGEAAARLAERYAAEGRTQDLLKLEKRRLSYARGQREEAAARVRLAVVWLDYHDDAPRARDEVERALRLFAGDAQTFRLYARTLDRAGELDRAIDAAEQAIGAPDADEHTRRIDRVIAAELCERAGKADHARRYAEDLLEEAPSDAPGLQLLARLATDAGELDEAFAAFERAAAVAEDDSARSRLYFELAQLCIRQGAPERARGYFDRAMEARPTIELLRAAAAHAEREGRLEDLQTLLLRLGELGDRSARTQRARLLIQLQRPVEAATEAEALATVGEPEALAVLVDARRAEGKPELLGAALERLIEVTREPEPRIELAKLRAVDGDLVRSRILLEEALAVTREEQRLLARDALEVLCDVLMRQGDDGSLEAALGRLAALREEPALRALALGAQGAARSRIGRLDAALGSYREAIACDPSDTQARMGLAETAYVLRLWDEARSSLEPIFEAAPRADRALRLGEIAERQGLPADAIRFYDAALGAGPSGADAQRIYVSLAALYHASGQWEAEARILVRAAEDARAVDNDAGRAGRLVHAADLLRKRVGRTDEALALYDRALALDAMCLPALDALESIAIDREDWGRAAQILSRKVAATGKRPADQKAILGRLALMQSEHLGRDDAAREAYARALVLDPSFRPALVFLARDARSRGQREEERERLERLASLPADPSEPEGRLTDLLRLGQLYLEDSRVDETEAVARRVLSEQPRNAAALALLDDVFTRGGRTAELEALLSVRAQIEPDHEAGVELLVRRAALLEEVGRFTDAIAAYEHVTSLRPAHAVGWGRLADLLRRTQAWAPLAGALGRLADWHSSASRREEAVSLYVEQAHVLHDQLGQADAARHVLERAREVWPGSRLVVGALLALARGRGDSAEEAGLLDQLVELETDPSARANAVFERARALVHRGERDEALRRLRELPVAQAGEGALRLRVDLEEAVGALQAAAEPLERLRQLAEAAGDHALERFSLSRLLRIAREQTPSRTEPLAARLVALDPDDRDALRALADAAERRGDVAVRTDALERLLASTRRHIGGPGEEAAISIQLAELAIAAGDRRAAQLRLREALDATPGDAPARRRLGLLLVEDGADVEASQHLGAAAERGVLPPEEQLILAEVYERIGQPDLAATATLAAGKLGSPTRRAAAAARLGQDVVARAAALEALAVSPRDATALDVLLRGLSPAALIAQLEELSSRIGAAHAAALLEQRASSLPPQDARVALERAIAIEPTAARWLRLATVSEGLAATEAYGRALALDPTSAEAALGRAERSEPDQALAVLRAALQAQPSRSELPTDSLARARLQLRLGELERDRGEIVSSRTAFSEALDDAMAAADSDDAAVDRQALELRVRAARALAAAARTAGDSEAAEAAIGVVIDSAAATDVDLRLLAELLLEREAVTDAIEILEGLRAPGDLYALALERAEVWPRLVDHLVRDAGSRPPAEARSLLLRASTVLTAKLDDPDRAVMLLERAVPLGPADAEIWERIGTLKRDRLDDPAGAAHALTRAIGIDPARRHLLLPLGDFHHEAGETAPAYDHYSSLLAGGDAPADALPRLHLRLAQYARAEADAIEEEHHLRAAVALGPSEEAWRRLVELYRVREDKLRLEQALLALADLVAPVERLALLREVRSIEGPAPHAEIDERILALDRNDTLARQRVLERLRRAEDPSALLDRLEREIESALGEGGAHIGPDLPLELGRVSLERGDLARAARGFRLAAEHGGGLAAAQGAVAALKGLGRLVEAAEVIEAVLAGPLTTDDQGTLDHLLLGIYLEIAPNRALALVEAANRRGVDLTLDAVDYRRLLRAEGRFELLLSELDRAALDAPEDQRLPLALEAAALLEGSLGRPRDAARRYAALFEANASRRDLSLRARELYAAAGEPIYALALVDRELTLAPPEDIPQLKITRGELLLAAGADAEAEAEFLHALITTKRVGRAHAALADVYRKRGDLASALEHLIAAADAPDLEPARAAHCAVDAADVLLIEGDTATSERLYQLAVALDPADRRALDALIRLAAAQHAHERQAELLGRAAALTADRRERARLLNERARLYETELGRDLDAYRAYKEAVACDPSLRDAVRSLRSLAEARGEWAVAAEQLYREAALADDQRERARLHIRLAQVHEERLFDSGAALRNLEQAAELLGDARVEEADSPWRALARLYAEEQRFADAAGAMEQVVEHLPDETPAATRAEAIQRAAVWWSRAGEPGRSEALRADAARFGDRLGATDELPADAPPDVQRRAIEASLRTVPEGERRVALLRRLVGLLAAEDDLAELDTRASELMQRAPDDPAAFLARRRVVEATHDPAALATLLRTRASVTADAHERAERRFEAGRIAETQLYDVATASSDYEAALDAEPDHVPALDALADLAFRTRHLQRARALYERLGDRTLSLGRDEVARRRGELAEEAGDHAAARTAYQAAVAHNATNLSAQQALARVSMRLEDDRGAFTALRAVLDLLPRDALDRAAELRRHLGELALRLGDLAEARALLETVLLEDPRRRDVLASLTDVYERTGAWGKAADLCARRVLLTERADERADLLFRQGEALTATGDPDAASDAYLKAADLDPRHAPTLRRLIRHYLGLGDLEALTEVIGELESLGAPLGDAALEAALGVALRGDEAKGAIIGALAQPTPEAIASAFATLPWPPPPTFDAAVRTAERAVGGPGPARERLLPALEARAAAPDGLTARFAAGLLAERAGRSGRARVHLEIVSFIAPTPSVDQRIAALGALSLPEPSVDQVVAAGARGALRDVLCDLAPLVLGLAVAPLDVESAPEAGQRIAPVASLFGYSSLEVALLDRLADPAWAEPTRPPRILLQRRFADDPRAARFAAARALHALHAGLGLIHGRTPDDIGALIRGAAALFLPDLRTDGPFVRAWQAELSALGLRPEVLPESLRTRLEVALANLLVDRDAAAQAPQYATAERLTANRVAYVVTGDLRAGLTALTSQNIADPSARERALREDPALVDLVAFALLLNAA